MEKHSYKNSRKPSKEFDKRSDYLENELSIMRPNRWGINLPGRDYRFEPEDIIPALAGTIGKVVMVAAMVGAWAAQYDHLDQGFIIENTRFEMILVSVLFIFLFSGFLNPKANLAGTHGPMIPMIPLIVASGGHPLALGILVGIFGFGLSITKGTSRLINLTGNGVRGGLLIYLGAVGTFGQLSKFKLWTEDQGVPSLMMGLIFTVLIVYAILAKYKMRWLSIPLCSAIALIVSYLWGTPFDFVTTPGIPHLDPFYWWGESTGWGMGWPELKHFIAVLPFALLTIAMWPPDFLGHRVFQEMNYPKKNEVLMNVDDTVAICSLRQAVGTLLGGGNLASSWGTYMIPAAIAKRPIPAGAILTGVFCIVAAVWGYPMDLASWKPVLVVALLVGVFLPLLEAGMQMVKDERNAQGAGICIFASALVNPVFGWSLTIVLDNLGLISDAHRGQELGIVDKVIIPVTTFVVCTGIMALVGMLPGIPGIF